MLGAGGVPGVVPLLWILVAGTGARTLAMALNRILDRGIDARNPRTAGRELPAGRMSVGQAWAVAVAGLIVFYGAVLRLPPLCLVLSPVPLAIFVGYPLMKRFTPLATTAWAPHSFRSDRRVRGGHETVLPLGAAHCWRCHAPLGRGVRHHLRHAGRDFDRRAGCGRSRRAGSRACARGGGRDARGGLRPLWA